MLKRFCAASALALLVGAGPVLAQPVGEQPRWIRHPALAPDGSMLSFTYRGQVHLVDVEGGLAVPLTAQGAYSHGAVWSPDGEYLALASDVNGNDDVYLADFSGTLQRYSWSSASEVPTSFAPDGGSVLYTAMRLGDAERSIQAALTRKPQLYAVDTQTGRESLVLPNMALDARWNPDQSRLVYTYDPSIDPAERQHRVAANARQLWIYDAVSGRHEPLFAVDGVDRLNPVWSADGASLYYLSEASGWLNAWQVDLATLEETQLTDFADDPVRDLSVADDGTIAFAWGGRIHIKAPGAEAPVPIEIMTLEQRAGNDLNFLATDIGEFVASPDGERFAVIAHCDVYLLDRTGLYRQLTATPGEEKNVGFSPDGSMLVYAAQRGHEWGLYAVDLQVEEDGPPLALRYEEIALHVPETGNAFQPAFSPDGSRIAFIADRREVQIMDLSSGEIHAPFGPGDYNSSYMDGDLWFAWSPTSQELLVQWRTVSGDEVSQVAIVPADGSAPPLPLPVTVGGLFVGSWSLDGTQIVAGTAHYGVRSAQQRSLGMDLYRVFASEAARQDFLDLYEGEAPEALFDEDGQFVPRRYDASGFRSQRRENRLTFGMAPSGMVEPYDQQRLLVVTAEGAEQYGIGFVDLKSGQVQPLQLVSVPAMAGLSYVPALGVIDFLGDGEIITVPLADPDGIIATPVEIFYASNRDRAREAAFEQAWADLNYTYYDPGLEGRDWQAIGAKYRAYLGSIASDRELRELISAMYGELSASHMFVSYDADAAGEGVGTHDDVLGVYLDHGYEGEGRRVAAVLPGGPLDRAGLGVDAGDIITSINGLPVPEAGGLDRLLDLNFGKRVLVGLVDGDEQSERLVYVDPISRRQEHALSRQRLLDARREMADRLSNGCVAYHHVPAMDNPAYLDVLGRLSSARGQARAALIDVRSNGGGNLTRELITLLTGEPYATMSVAGGPEIIEPSNRWLWPSAVLVDSFGYSDGSVFPQAFQDMGIGPLVGDTVLNTGTAVNYVDSKLVPGLNYGIPVLPFHRLDGTLYENYVIEPDIAVPHDPNRVGIGVDPQLEAGVAALMEQIGPEADCRLR